jgi:23S rRNA (cytosine1962-C5)-methyltransferase
MRQAVLTPKGVDRVKSGHVWIYRSDVARVEGDGGDIVDLLGPRGRPLGAAFFSDQSQIALRLLTRGGQALEDDWLRTRLTRAWQFRQSLGIEGTAWRLVHGEGDLLPSLVVDCYGGCLVVQTLSQATERLLPDVVRLLQTIVSPAPTGIIVRNDGRVRALEGLPQVVEVVSGHVPERVSVIEGRIRYDVDLFKGQKTGLFLDQRENRDAAARYAHGRLLDCFSYNGGFALALAPRCTSLTALEISADASAHIRENAALNGVDRLEVKTANVFDELHELDRADARFETIVLDPPAFAKNKASVPKAAAGYKEINLRALRLLPPGGVLVTCTCSHHVSEPLFEEIVRSAAADAGVFISIVESRTQGRDHPVLLNVPETRYLKCLILRKL